ncbi:MAG: hypothetical protein ACPGPS_04085 [Rubripirellula sp.]
MPQFVSTQIGKGTVLQAPTADGTVGQFLTTDGAGNLSFDTVAASPAGSDTQIQFNDGGAFGGSANLTWDDATLQVTGTSTTAPVVVAKMPASHTDNAFEIQDSTSAVIAAIDQTSQMTLTNASSQSLVFDVSNATANNPRIKTTSTRMHISSAGDGMYLDAAQFGFRDSYSTSTWTAEFYITPATNSAKLESGQGVALELGHKTTANGNVVAKTTTVTGGHAGTAVGASVIGADLILEGGAGCPAATTETATGGNVVIDGGIGYGTGSDGEIQLAQNRGSVRVSNAYTLPTADGTTGQFIKTDGAGNLSFDTVAASPSGADTQIQFNDGGSFGGSANLTWDDATLQVTGTNTAAPVLIAKMPASHTANAFEVQDSTGTVKSFINKDGDALFTELGIGGASQLAGYAVNMSGVFKTTGNMRLANGFGFNRPTDSASITPVEYTPVGGGATPNNLWINTNRGLVNNNTATYGQGGSIYLNCGAGGYGSTGDVDGGDAGRVVVRCKPGGTGIGTGIAGAEGGFEIVDDSLATLFAVLNDATIGFFGATPVAQQSTTGTTTGFTAGSGTSANDDSTYTGNTGSTAYTVGDIVLALKNLGLIAA